MRLMMFEASGGPRLGVVDGDKVIDVAAADLNGARGEPDDTGEQVVGIVVVHQPVGRQAAGARRLSLLV